MTAKNNTPTITRIDLDDQLSKNALEAERRLFDYYDLDYQIHYVQMDEPDLRLRVLEVGDGPPLLLVPGGSGDATMFAPLMAELRGWRIIALNRPGGGLSDGVDHRQVDLRQLAAESIRTVADAFDLHSVPIVCNSMGGLWSFWYTLAYPERVSKMVQMGCPALALNTSAPFFMRLLSVPGINRFIASQMQPNSVETALDGLRFMGNRQEDIDRMPRVAAESAHHTYQLPTYIETWISLVAAVTNISGAKARYQLGADQLEKVQQPVQFLWGDNDPFGDLEVAREIVAIMPNARLHEMQAGHIPFIDRPEICGAVIQEFLGQPQQQQVAEDTAVPVG